MQCLKHNFLPKVNGLLSNYYNVTIVFMHTISTIIKGIP